MKNSPGKSDSEIKDDILSELKYEPNVKTSDIGVLVNHGTVTLNGFASNYREKWDAVRAAKRVGGVVALADDIEIKLPNSMHRTDGDIATAAANQIGWSSTLPFGKVHATVRQGWVTLDGELGWWYQRNDAEDAVMHLAGVTGVTNLITVKPDITPVDIEDSIKAAFKRSALLDASKIEVNASSGAVTLRGKVRNYAEKEEAERAAWSAPGVHSVDSQLIVLWSWFE